MTSARPRAVVLLSGGLDSTVNLYETNQRAEVALALTFDYGQRAASREITFARAQCEALGVAHETVEVRFFERFTRTALVARSGEVPTGEAVEIDDLLVSERTARAVWVPNRNGILLNIGAGFAEGLGAKWIVPGFNLEEAATFADNTEGFLQALCSAFRFSTSNAVEAVCFTTGLRKPDIVRRGVELGVHFEHIWPCYFGGETPCGSCESCRRYDRARSLAVGVGAG